MSKLETNQVDPSTGTTLTLGTSGDTIAIPSGVTIANSGTATGFGGANTPFTTVKKDSDQTLSHGADTKITFDSVVNESASSIFDLTNNKFTVASAGTYLILPQIRFYDSDNRIERAQMYIRKNNSNHKSFTYYDNGYSSSNTREITVGSGFLETLAVSDYIEMYVYVVTNDSGSIVAESDHLGTTLGVMKIIT